LVFRYEFENEHAGGLESRPATETSMKPLMIASLLSTLSMFPVANATPPSYSITDLGLGVGISGFGNNNQVLAVDPSGELILIHPNGTMSDLTILVQDSPICLGPAHNTWVNGLSNNNGTELVLNTGYERGDCSMTYKSGVLTYHDSYIEGEATGINDSGQVIGNSQPQTGVSPTNCDFAGSSFGRVFASLINDSAQIVGIVDSSNAPVLCTAGTWAALPQLPGASESYGSAINSRGAIAGTTTVKAHSHGFFINAKGAIGDLGVDIQISDMNANNQFVGSHTTGTLNSFTRITGVTYDLVSLINPNDPLQPYVTFANPSVRINDNGVIAVIGTDSRTSLNHVYLLKPM
jgi:hypothetical protein